MQLIGSDPDLLNHLTSHFDTASSGTINKNNKNNNNNNNNNNNKDKDNNNDKSNNNNNKDNKIKKKRIADMGRTIKRQFSETDVSATTKIKKIQKFKSMNLEKTKATSNNVNNNKNANVDDVIENDDDAVGAMLRKGERSVVEEMRELLTSHHVRHTERVVEEEQNKNNNNNNKNNDNNIGGECIDDGAWDHLLEAGCFDVILCVDIREMKWVWWW